MYSLSGNRLTGLLIIIAAVALLFGAFAYRMLEDDSGLESEVAEQAGISMPQTLTEMEAAANAEPDNARLWEILAEAQFERGLYAEAASAFAMATQVDSNSAFLWASLGEALVYSSQDDPMPPAALDAFNRAIALDAGEPRARYFLAVQKDLNDDHQGAITDWLALLADTPPGSVWENDLVRTIEQVGAINDIAVSERIASASATRNLLPSSALPSERGPTQEQMAAASALSPSQQQDMAEGMVERLAGRLEINPSDVEGWIMLMRSYKTLGRDAQAEQALANAIGNNPEAEPLLREAASTLGI